MASGQFSYIPHVPVGRALLALLLMLGISACSTRPQSAQTSAIGKAGTVDFQETEVPADVFTVPEIPIAPNSQIIKEDTVIVGSDDNWTGQVILHAPFRVAQMTEFYRKEMPKFGWSETSIVRARRTAISFQKDRRVVIVRISAVSDSEAEVDLVVSPNFSAGEALPAQRNQPGFNPRQNQAPGVQQVPIPRSRPN
jgi:hypothetical protein